MPNSEMSEERLKPRYHSRRVCGFLNVQPGMKLIRHHEHVRPHGCHYEVEVTTGPYCELLPHWGWGASVLKGSVVVQLKKTYKSRDPFMFPLHLHDAGIVSGGRAWNESNWTEFAQANGLGATHD